MTEESPARRLAVLKEQHDHLSALQHRDNANAAHHHEQLGALRASINARRERLELIEDEVVAVCLEIERRRGATPAPPALPPPTASDDTRALMDAAQTALEARMAALSSRGVPANVSTCGHPRGAVITEWHNGRRRRWCGTCGQQTERDGLPA